MTSVAWTPKVQLDQTVWADHGRRLGLIGRCSNWWIGDWVSYGNHAYGERYARAARVTRLDVQTLMNLVYVASRFEVSRRRETLSWSHHAELAALDAQEGDLWLDLAEAERMSVRCLRDELRAARRRCVNQSRGEATLSSATDSARARMVCPNCGSPVEPPSS